MIEKFDLILTDPPWKQQKGGKKKDRPNSSGGNLDYQVISIEQILDIQKQVKELCNEKHICFLWTIDKYLHEAEEMMKQLGYKLHARMIWNKVTGIPAAFTVRYGHEYLLYFYHGNLIPIALDMRGKQHTVFVEQVKKHSQKPEYSYKMIESFYPDLKKIELFARQRRIGWSAFGNEIESDIIIENE